jgi:hypothetical protein
MGIDVSGAKWIAYLAVAIAVVAGTEVASPGVMWGGVGAFGAWLAAQARAAWALWRLPPLWVVMQPEFLINVGMFSLVIAGSVGALVLHADAVDAFLVDRLFRHAALRAFVRHVVVDAVKPHFFVMLCTILSTLFVEWLLGGSELGAAAAGGGGGGVAVEVPWLETIMRNLTYFTPLLAFYIHSFHLVDLSRRTKFARQAVERGVFGLLFFWSAVFRLQPVLYAEGRMDTVAASWVAVCGYPIPTLLHGLVAGIPPFYFANKAGKLWPTNAWVDVGRRITLQLAATCVVTVWSIAAGNDMARVIIADASPPELRASTVLSLRLFHVLVTGACLALYHQALTAIHVTSPLLKLDVAWPSALSIVSMGSTLQSVESIYKCFRDDKKDFVALLKVIAAVGGWWWRRLW